MKNILILTFALTLFSSTYSAQAAEVDVGERFSEKENVITDFTQDVSTDVIMKVNRVEIGSDLVAFENLENTIFEDLVFYKQDFLSLDAIYNDFLENRIPLYKQMPYWRQDQRRQTFYFTHRLKMSL